MKAAKVAVPLPAPTSGVDIADWRPEDESFWRQQGARIASETAANPYLVMMPDGAAELEVAVYKKGYNAFVKKHQFVAGERAQTLNVVLEPDANAGGSSP